MFLDDITPEEMESALREQSEEEYKESLEIIEGKKKMHH